MARKVFVSFRFDDGFLYKELLGRTFDKSTEVINRSENEDRSKMSESTIKKYLYDKLRDTSVTIVLLTPKALNHKRDNLGRYDDWMYDEIRYSLEDRENNRTNGLIAVYAPEAEDLLISEALHSCPTCQGIQKVISVRSIDNLARKNMQNVKDVYKSNPCSGLYDGDWDSYCSLVSWDMFVNNYNYYIEMAAKKREMAYKYDVHKQ